MPKKDHWVSVDVAPSITSCHWCKDRYPT